MTPDKSTTSDSDTQPQFSREDLELMTEMRSWAETQVARFPVAQQHRALLGMASELVDSAAELASVQWPGVRAVELSLLAERIASLSDQAGSEKRDV